MHERRRRRERILLRRERVKVGVDALLLSTAVGRRRHAGRRGERIVRADQMAGEWVSESDVFKWVFGELQLGVARRLIAAIHIVVVAIVVVEVVRVAHAEEAGAAPRIERTPVGRCRCQLNRDRTMNSPTKDTHTKLNKN